MTDSEKKSVVARVPLEVADGVRVVAAMQGKSSPEVFAAAWREYIEKHAAELQEDFEEAARLLRDGDVDALAAFASRSAKERAQAAVRQMQTPPKPSPKPFPDGGLNPRERREEKARQAQEQVGK